MPFTPEEGQIRTFGTKSDKTPGSGLYAEIPQAIVDMKKLTGKQIIFTGLNDRGHIVIMTQDEWGNFVEEIPEEA